MPSPRPTSGSSATSEPSPIAAGFHAQLREHVSFLYPDANADLLVGSIVAAFDSSDQRIPPPQKERWSEADSLLITYGDSVRSANERPLQTLRKFLQRSIGDAISCVHVLPFCPYSSDDGFAVIDYTQVDPALGDWDDLSAIADSYRLMADLVINHVSAQSDWFRNYIDRKEPGATWFYEANAGDDLSQVVRPRSSSLLRPTETADGLRHVWCTFSHDQIDLDFRNPQVLLQFLKVIRLYLQRGVRLFRLDAIGFLWKEPGTTCLHLPQTHEVVKLLRCVLDQLAPGTILITETNVPNHENLSYFGNRNEAHVIYNFSLAPLLVHALLTGKTEYLKRWLMSMPPAPLGCTYLNFTASHDGIGMRPAEGLLSDEEQLQMVDTIREFGGRVSTRTATNGEERVYELNIALFDALQGTVAGKDQFQRERFLCSQTVMLGMDGIPAFYIHSLLATANDEQGMNRTGQNRSINRHKWNLEDLERRLEDSTSDQSVVLSELLRRLKVRRRQPAFHPNATQYTLQLADPFFAFWRQSQDREQSIFCIHNMTDAVQPLRLSDLNLITLNSWQDLLTGTAFDDLTSTIDVQPYQCLWISNRSGR
ncbi:MAG: alpha-amylase family glycosyl hydrolase [Fuerstiella sp.]